ncbi:MAG: DUF2202 domain-containing protein [SAR324 cluster bacterium]|nr:DUF2202 domain-containing protein [SAR324 cluster bacterium]
MIDINLLKEGKPGFNSKVMVMCFFAVAAMVGLFFYITGNDTNSATVNLEAGIGTNVALVANPKGGVLTSQEYQYLVYMREEEKLARDVYQFLFQKWQLSIFYSIAQSEHRHTGSIGSLLQTYDIADPTLNFGPGEYKNTHITELYQQLTSKGQESVLEALKVGALIEEVDIHDLDLAIQATDKNDIIMVYSNIRNGSYHHFRAFVHSIELYGQPYQAAVLPQKTVDMIVQSPLLTMP